MAAFKYIRKQVVGEIVEKKSRFIASLAPVRDEEEALSFISSIKKKYCDARHNCYAYIAGENDQFIHSSDDGEPAHTAGRPMMDILQKEDLHNVCVVVTRYFGGILLGTGGLVRAYSDALKAAIAEAEIYELQPYLTIHVACDYKAHGKIANYAATEDYKITDIIYNEAVEFNLLIKPDDKDMVLTNLTDLTTGSAALTVGDIVIL